MSVRRAQGEIDSREFLEWMAYERISPSDPERQDLRFAMIACMLANFWREKGRQPYEFKDFMLKFESVQETSDQTAQRIQNQIQLWAAQHNRRLERGQSG